MPRVRANPGLPLGFLSATKKATGMARLENRPTVVSHVRLLGPSRGGHQIAWPRSHQNMPSIKWPLKLIGTGAYKKHNIKYKMILFSSFVVSLRLSVSAQWGTW